MRPSEKWKPAFSPNHSANQNAGTTKMLPPSGKEGHSPNENAGFPDKTDATCNRTNDNVGFPDAATEHLSKQYFQTQQKPCVNKV